MSERKHETYQGCQIEAAGVIDPIAGDGLQLNPVYRPVACVTRWVGGAAQKKRLDDAKGRVFANPDDAVKLALAIAKRYVDELPA